MIPTIDERLASVVRALTDVVIPSLPPEAGLAIEQAHLSIGHLEIIRSQLDAVSSYEKDELADAVAIGTALGGLSGGPETKRAVASLLSAVEGSVEVNGIAEQRSAGHVIHAAIAALIPAISVDGDVVSRASLKSIVIEQERSRVLKDRRWCAPFGFDSVPTA